MTTSPTLTWPSAADLVAHTYVSCGLGCLAGGIQWCGTCSPYQGRVPVSTSHGAQRSVVGSGVEESGLEADASGGTDE